MAGVRTDGRAFLGVVAEIKRADRYNYHADACSVFGLNQDEYNTLTSLEGIEFSPKTFEETCPKFFFKVAPWVVLRALGEEHGYVIPCTPLCLSSGDTNTKQTLVVTIIKPLNKA